MANGICIAFGQNAFTTSPTWTRIDDPTFDSLQNKGSSPFSGRFVTSFQTDRGRAYELDKTEAGTATITCYDTSGYFDPTNANSPFYGFPNKITPMMRARINVENPSQEGDWHDIFTGFVESFDWTMDTASRIMTVKIGLVDGFEVMNRAEIPPDATGTTTLPGFTTSNAVQTRIIALLDALGWPGTTVGTLAEWRNINSGNVKTKTTIYNPQTSYLSAIQDVADAEFPGVANFFMGKHGDATFYGRYPRFQPTNYPQDVTLWQVADASAANTFGAARIADIEWTMDSKNLINACLCYPYGILQSQIQAQIVTDPTSIGKFGIRTLSLPDLIVDGQNSGGGISPQPALSDLLTCQAYGAYYVDNYAAPQIRISKLEFHSRLPGDSQTWAFILGVEIGDLLTVFTRNPGGGGFSKSTDGMTLSQFFVEGIHNTVNPLRGNVLDWTMTLDVSPRAWFVTAPFGS